MSTDTPRPSIRVKRTKSPSFPPPIVLTGVKTAFKYKVVPYPNIRSPTISDVNKLQFKNVETSFNRMLWILSKRKFSSQMTTNMIRSDAERQEIIEHGNKLYHTEQYCELSQGQVYMVLVYTYYAIHLVEQYWDRLIFKHIRFYFSDTTFQVAKNLFFDVTTKDIVDEDNVNLSSEIRRSFMGLVARIPYDEIINNKNDIVC